MGSLSEAKINIRVSFFGWQLAGPKFKLLMKKQIRHETGPEQRLRAEN